jgi:methylated-DNA-protein-cysteine methyltransferase-like protein
MVRIAKASRTAGVGFFERVYDVVRQVPRGRVATYGQVATLLGSPRAARQVGFALSALRDREELVSVPWHRIINGRGRISVRGDTLRGCEQQRLLESEGVIFDAGGKTALAIFGWDAAQVQVPSP